MLDVDRTREAYEVFRLLLDAMQGRVWTAMPGIVKSYNAENQTCEVQCAIMAKVRALDNVGGRTGPYENMPLPLLVDCPVVFPQGGGFALTFPIAALDEVLVVFSSRCIDAWWESGASQEALANGGFPQAEMRLHDLSDGFVLPGPKSKTTALTNVSPDSVQLRTADGSIFVEVSDSGVHIKGGLTVEGDIDQSGDFTITGDVEFIGTVKANGVCIDDTHVHPETGSTTGPAQCPP